MKGFVWRLSIAMKDAGERLRLPALIRFGLALRAWVASLKA